MLFKEEIIQSLKSGGIGIIPTDTLYGVVASAWNISAVERVYAVRKRDLDKPCIILIADSTELEHFSIKLSPKEKAWLETIWPGKVSVMLPCPNKDVEYLSRGTGYLVFRIPDDESLRTLLRETGPLIAPSANPQGVSPAENIDEARKYFGDSVDFFVDGGMLQGKPSTIVQLENDQIIIIRPGVVEIKGESIKK